MVDRLRGLLPQALDVLARELEGEAPLPAAIHVLRCCGVYGGIAVPTGPTDPELIAAQQQLAEDARQHAAEEAAVTIKRRTFDRFLTGMAADPTGSLLAGAQD